MIGNNIDILKFCTNIRIRQKYGKQITKEEQDKYNEYIYSNQVTSSTMDEYENILNLKFCTNIRIRQRYGKQITKEEQEKYDQYIHNEQVKFCDMDEYEKKLNFCVNINIKQKNKEYISEEELKQYKQYFDNIVITAHDIEQYINGSALKNPYPKIHIDCQPLLQINKHLNELLNKYIEEFKNNNNTDSIETQIIENYSLTKPQLCQALCYYIDENIVFNSHFYKSKICEKYKQNIDMINKNSKYISENRPKKTSNENNIDSLLKQCKKYFDNKRWSLYNKTQEEIIKINPNISKETIAKYCNGEKNILK